MFAGGGQLLRDTPAKTMSTFNCEAMLRPSLCPPDQLPKCSGVDNKPALRNRMARHVDGNGSKRGLVRIDPDRDHGRQSPGIPATANGFAMVGTLT
jgi:hypothetical protein